MKSRDNIMVALASGDQKSKAIAATALTLGLGNKPNVPPQTNFKTKASNCVLVTIVVICVCVLVACGVMIVREYALAKGYHATRCRVSSSLVFAVLLIRGQFLERSKICEGPRRHW